MKALALHALLLGALSAGLAGCGSPPTNCGSRPVTMAISPAVATANHAATPPANQQQFRATSAPAPTPGCAQPAVLQLLTPKWTVSDPVHVTISSADDSTNGLATCLAATNGPVTLTANAPALQPVTATLTCK